MFQGSPKLCCCLAYLLIILISTFIKFSSRSMQWRSGGTHTRLILPVRLSVTVTSMPLCQKRSKVAHRRALLNGKVAILCTAYAYHQPCTRVFSRLKFVHYRQVDKKKKWSLRTTNRNTSLPIRSYWMICIDPRRSFRVSFWHCRMMNISKKTQPVQMVTVTNEQESTWTLSGSVVVDAARRSQMDTFKVIWQYHSTMKN